MQDRELPADVIVHRIGGVGSDNLLLSRQEAELQPPGISVLLGGTGLEAQQQMLTAYPDSRKHRRIHEKAVTVASSSVAAIRGAGFDVIAMPTKNFPNHGRLIHPQGASGFSEDALGTLARAFSPDK